MIFIIVQRLNNGTEIVEVKDLYMGLTTMLNCQYANKPSIDRSVAAIMSDVVLVSRVIGTKTVIEVKGKRKNMTYTYVSDKMLGYNALLASIYKLRIEGKSVERIANLSFWRGRAEVDAIVDKVGDGHRGIRISVKEGKELMVEQSLQFNKFREVERYSVVRFRINRYKSAGKLEGVFGKCFEIIGNYKLEQEGGNNQIVESLKEAYIVNGTDVLLLCTDKAQSEGMRNFVAECEECIGISNVNRILML